MTDNPLTSNNDSNEPALNKVLIAWIKVVTDFYVCHSQLVALIDQSAVGQRFVGQCLVSSLWEMTASMEVGMERLLNDLPPIGAESINHERIKRHTAQLNQLIHQAQLLLHLASLLDS